MNNTYAWVVVVCSEGEKNYAHAWKLNNKSNVISQIKELRAGCVHLCGTKKEACGLAEFWNQCYKENGTYMFDGTF